MRWSTSGEKPDTYGPCLCNVMYRSGPAWEVLYHHPRKGWVFKEGLALSSDAKVMQWVEVGRIIKQPLQ